MAAKTAPLPPRDRDRVAALVARDGLRSAAATLGLNVATTAKAALGEPLQAITRTHIVAHLPDPSASPASAPPPRP